MVPPPPGYASLKLCIACSVHSDFELYDRKSKYNLGRMACCSKRKKIVPSHRQWRAMRGQKWKIAICITFYVFVSRAAVSRERGESCHTTLTHDRLSLQAEVVVNYHVGETVLSLQKTTLIPGGSESLVYTTLSGGIGILVPFTSHEV